MPSKVIEQFKTDDQKWDAVCENDASADGVFLYGVTSTSVVCKPSCRSPKPNRENVRYFEDVSTAIAQGFRPCKRCRP